jgi:hypothetical protein
MELVPRTQLAKALVVLALIIRRTILVRIRASTNITVKYARRIISFNIFKDFLDYLHNILTHS